MRNQHTLLELKGYAKPNRKLAEALRAWYAKGTSVKF
jgi:hypothetical protein